MNVLDAAYAVLRDAGSPLHCTVITQRMLDRKLWRTEGKTPVNTVGASLAVDVKRNGAASRFVRTAKGVFGLREWHWGQGLLRGGLAGTPALAPATEPAAQAPAPADSPVDATRTADAADAVAPAPTLLPEAPPRRGTPLNVSPEAIAQYNQSVEQALLGELHQLAPVDFEQRVTRLLLAFGMVQPAVTPRWHEGGFDVRGTLVVGEVIRTRLSVQVRRWRHTVQAPEIVQIRGLLGAHEQGLLITTGDVGSGARDEADRTDTAPVGLIDGRQLAGLLAGHGIGVRRVPHMLLALGEEEVLS